MARRSYLGKVVTLTWSDAFDDSDLHPDDLSDEYVWNTYGRVIRQTDDHITITTSEGGQGKDAKVFATTVLWPMVRKVHVHG